MWNQLTVFRAVAGLFFNRIYWWVLTFAIIFSLTVLGLIWLLAHELSTWFWLFLAIYIPVLLVLFTALVIVRWLINRFLPQQFSKKQRKQVNAFVDKLMRVIEARTLGRFFIVLVSIKDLVVHRRLKTLQSLVSDTTSLKRDHQALVSSLTKN